MRFYYQVCADVPCAPVHAMYITYLASFKYKQICSYNILLFLIKKLLILPFAATMLSSYNAAQPFSTLH
jgi:membrane-anchored glycerophosphoryl diester phosphodiesterase (GDPDase)